MIRKTPISAALLSCLLSVPLYAEEAIESSPLKCNDEELATFMDSYQKGLEKNVQMTPKADYSQMKNADTARQVNDPDADQALALCGLVLDADFDLSLTMPDFDFVFDMQKSLQALMAADSAGGVDYSTVISTAIMAGMEKAKKAISEGMCKLATKATSSIDPLANDLYKDAKKKGKQMFLDNEDVQALGVKNYDTPIWQQMAGKELDNQLGEYSKYSKWYEDGWNVEDAMGGAAKKKGGQEKEDWLDHLKETDPTLDGGLESELGLK